MKRIAVIAGARPNFMKVAPILRACAARGVEALLVHTGQHYDVSMSGSFFDVLGLPEADVNFGVGSGSHSVQTAAVMTHFESWLEDNPVDAVVVVGDVNSTMACSVVAAKVGVPVAHVEAGLRSFDRTMPEEVNRVLTDSLATWMFATTADAVDNLLAEGADPSRIFLVGNVMADSLLHSIDRARQRQPWVALGLPDRFALITLHRPALVDNTDRLAEILKTLADFADSCPFVFPIHPRTRGNVERAGLDVSGFHLIEPLDYLDFLAMQERAAVVITDSGGVQEETSLLGTWCITVRENTERSITVTHGTNTLVGFVLDRLGAAVATALDRGPARPASIPHWDGKTAERIVDVLVGPPRPVEWIPPATVQASSEAFRASFC
ncbi:MAG TPA: UDP-N-acetylglucosamine 2-epimerase (non-hydrolyzing) [Ilumatobacteraceae bacterium]